MENPLLQSAGGTVLPAALAAFLRRRLFELSGVALLTVTAALAVALASYHTGDPSLNSATGRLPQNLLGLPGAYIADLGLQTVGLAAAVPVLVFAAWGWRLLRKLSVSLIAVRFLLMLAALFLLGMALGHVPPPAEWSLNTGPGGAAGALMLTRAADTLHALGAPYGVWIAAGLAATVGMLALITAIGLTWAEWQAIGNALKTSVLAAGRVAAAGAGLARRAVVRPAADSGGRIEPALDEDGDIDTHIKVSPEAP
ncbi:MAG: DNA translocase FtsK 4TM domain-containing protein, partial [Rhodospirillales bacterium]|nr:DNA translocase FtsK 4TM domain-containing protein [Rhodospirillales bacterium]